MHADSSGWALLKIAVKGLWFLKTSNGAVEILTCFHVCEYFCLTGVSVQFIKWITHPSWVNTHEITIELFSVWISADLLDLKKACVHT